LQEVKLKLVSVPLVLLEPGLQLLLLHVPIVLQDHIELEQKEQLKLIAQIVMLDIILSHLVLLQQLIVLFAMMVLIQPLEMPLVLHVEATLDQLHLQLLLSENAKPPAVIIIYFNLKLISLHSGSYCWRS
jgi:hypothetical protein